MGQVVTDVQIVDGQIRVFFGPCCWKDLGNITELVKDADEVADDPLNPDGDPNAVYSACGKAFAIVDTIYTVADAVWENSLAAPWTWVGVVEDAIPGNNDLDDNQIISAFLTADLLRGLQYTEGDIFDEADKQQLICYVRSLLSDDAAGITRTQWDGMIGQMSGIYGEVVNDFFRYCADAIGPSDMRDITKLAAMDTTHDCDCPVTNPEEFYGLVAWARTVQSIGREDGTFTPVGRTAGGLTYEYQFQSANGGVKALTFDHYFDIDPTADITELTVALEPIAPADELLHRNWDASGCSNLNELEDVNGEMFPSSTGVTRRYKWDNGRFYYQWTKTTPAQAIFWRVSEGRVCPSDSTNNPGKLYRWKAHIVSVNNVDTGVVPDTTWP